jgi:hypothetical protein
MPLDLARVNSAIDNRIVVANHVIVNDLAIVVDVGALNSDQPEVCAVLGREVAGWRPAIVCGAIAKAETDPNAASCPCKSYTRPPAAPGRKGGPAAKA